ncbi:NAD-dependent epimerase/dehydratase family protein [Vitellibacter sp. q18]|nr:NAD-dependent epimerase/dehydratase family protein [Aequorivita lutea]
MILVTGGTGLVGSHLLYFLLKKNKRVRAIHRKNSNLESVKKVFSLYGNESQKLFEAIEWRQADITDIPALTAAFHDITEVYHCAAFINFNSSKYSVLKKVNVEGTANIINLCIANGIRKICYVSSVATFGNVQPNQLITEETPWNPDEKNSVYGITKYGAEMEVWRGSQEGLDVLIVNPGIIFGTPPEDGGSNTLINIGASGIPFYPTGSMGLVDVQDVAAIMIELMDSEIKNEQFILVSENMAYKQLLTMLAPMFGKKPPTKKLWKGVMLFLSGMDWCFHKIFGTKRRIPKATVRSMFTKSSYDASKVKDRLNYSFIPITETLQRVVAEREHH